MAFPGSSRRGWERGCIFLAMILGVFVLIGATLLLSSWREMRSENPEVISTELALPYSIGPDEGEELETTTLDFEISSAALVVVPVAAGEPLGIEADFDPRYYDLEHEMSDGEGEGPTYRIRFTPKSPTRALLKMKIGHEPPRIRVFLPRGQLFSLEGTFQTSLAAFELGGLSLRDLEMEVEGGAVNLSFLEPLSAPVESFSIVGDKGSIEVTGLGHASPREVRLHQRFGELDLDLRGPWSRDANLDLEVFMAGGSVWLPDDVIVEGLDNSQPPPMSDSHDELTKPRLRITLSRSGGQLIFID